MMKKLFILALVISLFFVVFSCNEKATITHKNIENILLKEVKTKIKLSKLFSKIDYISLQTTNESLIGKIEKLLIYNNVIYMIDGFLQNTNIKSFSIEGKFIREIGSIGKGPEEIMGPRDIYICKDTLFIWDKKGIHSFSLSGLYQNFLFKAFFAGDNFFCWNNNFYLFHSRNKPGLLSKYNINGDKLKVFNNINYWLGGAEGETVSKINNNTFSLFSPNLDTVYYFKSDSLIPQYTFKCKSAQSFSNLLYKYRNLTPPERLEKTNKTPNYTIYKYLENKTYIYLLYVLKSRKYTLIVNKRTGEKFYFDSNSIDKGVFNDALYITDDNKLVIPLYPYDILKHFKKHKNKKKNTKFRLLSKELKLSDNPILMFCKLNF